MLEDLMLEDALGKFDVILPDGTHLYWSTHCRHGDHDLCKGCCKKCKTAAPCRCECHSRPTQNEELTEEKSA